MKERIKVGVAYMSPSFGAVGDPPKSEEWLEERRGRASARLRERFPEIEFSWRDIKSQSDVDKFLRKETDAAGYIVFLMQGINELSRPILHSGKPIILISETYGGSGDYLLEYGRAKEAGYPINGLVTRDIGCDEVLEKVTLLEVIGKLKDSKVIFLVAPGTYHQLNLQHPLNNDMISMIRNMQTVYGVISIPLDVLEFKKKYYEKVEEEEVKRLAERWIKEASENREENIDEIKKSAKLYFAMQEVVKDYDANAIAVDCILLYRRNFLDAWPCLGFMEFSKEGKIVPVCEADAPSAICLLIVKYLTGLPGFINDPSPDDTKSEVVYYHCYAPINPFGEQKVPYTITSAHLGGKHASVFVELPVNKTITAMGLDLNGNTLFLHRAEVISNEYSLHACSTKLIGRVNTKALAENWRWRSGWHRVVVYGDWKEKLKDLASLLNLKVIEEDRL